MKNSVRTSITKVLLSGLLTIMYSCTSSKESTLPVLTTVSISEITEIAAVSGGNITDDGGDPVSARGVCWGTASNPVATGPHTTDGTGTGTFTSSITGLAANTAYSVRAYAINSLGTAYGIEKSFATVSAITTTEVSSITTSAALSGGNITHDNGNSIIERGVCWSTTANPTILNPHSSDGSGTGIFTSNLSGLTAGTSYFVRAYATTSTGTSYGNQVNFSTISSTNEVSIQGSAFSPAVITVAKGSTITWTNKDGMAHTVTSDDGTFNSGNIGNNGTWSRQFNNVGEFPYHCALHSSMTGKVVVVQ